MADSGGIVLSHAWGRAVPGEEGRGSAVARKSGSLDAPPCGASGSTQESTCTGLTDSRSDMRSANSGGPMIIDPGISNLTLEIRRGRYIPDRIVLEPIGDELMRRTGVAVVSAWQCLKALLPTTTSEPDRILLERLSGAVCADVGRQNSGQERAQLYECFIQAYRFYGEDWALPSLVSHLEWCGAPVNKFGEWFEDGAVRAWMAAVGRYELVRMLK